MEAVSIGNLRGEIDAYLAIGDFARAKRLLVSLWRASPQVSTARFVISRYAQMNEHVSTERRRVAVLRSFTLEPVEPLLKAEALIEARLELEIRFGEFNAYMQEALAEGGWLSEASPDAIIVAVQTRDVAPELWNRYSSLSRNDERIVSERVSTDFETVITALRSRFECPLIVHGLETPPMPSWGVLEANGERSQAKAVSSINERLQEGIRGRRGVYFLNYDGLIAKHGRVGWYDERKWQTVRLPISADRQIGLAREWTSFLAPAFGRTAKVLAIDLDNTLWSGIVGEDGVDGLRCGDDPPGAFHRGLQRALLDLRDRGILLAITSKNNEAEAFEALRKHPDLLVRPEHFSAIRCGWQTKAEGLREIAAELNVGLDSVAFLDDNPIERDQVAGELPEVHVLDPQELPRDLERTVRECPLFERLALSEEDRNRSEYYAAQGARREARLNTVSLTDFYRTLNQVVSIETCSSANIERIAQLTQKTNQFNLTTRRYTVAQIESLAARNDRFVAGVRVTDRYGDNGLVGVCILADGEESLEIETFLLSCRVIGRTVEDAVLAHIAELCSERGYGSLRGWFYPTAKNAPAADFFSRHNFRLLHDAGSKGALWSLPADRRPACPDWIRLETRPQDEARDLTYSN